MKTLNFSLSERIAAAGIEKAIPNMIYGDALFVFSFILRLLLFSQNTINLATEYDLFIIPVLSLFFLGILIAIFPTIIGGAILGLWMSKNVISIRAGLSKGAFAGFVSMLLTCALIYLIAQPHGVPDPSFPLNAGIATMISTLAGARTGMQVAKEFVE